MPGDTATDRLSNTDEQTALIDNSLNPKPTSLKAIRNLFIPLLPAFSLAGAQTVNPTRHARDAARAARTWWSDGNPVYRSNPVHCPN